MKKVLVLISFVWAVLVIGSIHGLEFRGSVPHFLKVANGEALLDVKPAFSEMETYQRIERYGDEGRKAYMFRLVTADILLPLSLSLFFVLFAKYSQIELGHSRRLINALVIGAFGFLVFDLLENLFLFLMISDFPNRLSVVAAITPYVSVIKRVSSFLGLGTTLWLAVLIGLKKYGVKRFFGFPKRESRHLQ